ncbi:3,4-dihydroxy-2-butanone-4-phosphate synthase [Buchnera aphidicola (Mindarus keteleerifoliae)]|uniref:3,4-dihydroxy-2-butanone-4-phosphate synthase n=1 Tax=Buchnera aphidicola TaxID=9 RepID=UPI0031B6F46F
MKKNLLKAFGNSRNRVLNAIKELKNGNGIILLDNENRENEGDLVFSGEMMTVEQMALSIRYGSGIVCLCITEKKRKKLHLPMMVKNNTSSYGTRFTVSIEAAKGVSTGVSAKDRITTIKTAISKKAQPEDLNRPGHVFPLCAHKDGLSGRNGHTEASIELIKLAGFNPTAVLSELTNKDGSMAKIPDIINFSKKKNIKVLTIKDIINFISPI